MRTNKPNYFIEKLFIDNDDLVIDWNDGKRSRLYSHWLRDHCQMPTSRNTNNGQRFFSISSVLKNTYIEKANIDEKSDVCVRFQPEDYVSIFSQDWLRKNCYNLNNPFDDRSEKNKKLWKKSSFNNNLPRVKY